MQRKLAHRMAGSLGILLATTCMVHIPDAAASQAASPAEVKQIMRMMKAEEARPVGQPLPDDITALDSEGKSVRLRDVLHGPAIVIKTEYGCPPCARLIEFLRTRGATYSRTHNVQLVVLNTASPDDPQGAKYPKDLPAPILTLHRDDMMLSGFFGGSGFYPYLFFLDRKLTLVGRRLDIRNPIESAFEFPKRSQTPATR